MAKAARTRSQVSTASILHLVKQVQYKAYVRLEALFQPLGITAVQFRIMTTISTRPGVSSAELARLYDVKPQTMIKQIAILESKKLIGRQTSRTNKRLLELTLTREGQAVLDQCQKSAQALEREFLQPLSADEQAALRSYLTRLRDADRGPGPDSSDLDVEEFSREYRRAGVQRV